MGQKQMTGESNEGKWEGGKRKKIGRKGKSCIFDNNDNNFNSAAVILLQLFLSAKNWYKYFAKKKLVLKLWS